MHIDINSLALLLGVSGGAFGLLGYVLGKVSAAEAKPLADKGWAEVENLLHHLRNPIIKQAVVGVVHEGLALLNKYEPNILAYAKPLHLDDAAKNVITAAETEAPKDLK